MKRLILILLSAALATVAVPSVEAQSRRALIVTVGKYKDPDVLSFIPGGEQRDGQYIKIALKSQGITDLMELSTDKSTPPERYATLENIQQAMKRLQRETKPGDVVVLYFSGHGSRAGAHFTLCPYDASPSVAGNDIEDTYLADWVQSLSTDNITLILDCCFTEYPVKDPLHRPKYLRRDRAFNSEPLAPIFPQDKVVILKASRNDEEAQEEDETGTGKWVGVFTRWLCYELKMPNSRELTYAQLMQRVNRGVQREIARGFHHSFSQTPQLDGSDMQKGRKLFASQKPVLPPHINISRLRNGQVALNGGTEQEVTVGSEYSLFDAKKADFNKPLGKIQITEAYKNRATARVLNGSGFRNGDLAVETIHKEKESEKGLFRIRIEASQSTKSEIEKALRTLPQIQLVQNHPALVLNVERQQGEFIGKLFRTDGDNAYGDPIQQVNAASVPGLAKALRPGIATLGVLRGLLALNNPNPSINLRMETEKTVHPFGEPFKVTFEAVDTQGKQVDCYITVIDIDANGIPTIIFPNPAKSELRDNHFRQEGDGAASKYEVTLHSFPPAGQDTLIAIATRQTIVSLDALVTWQAAGSAGTPSKGVEALGAQIQRKPLNDWAKAIATVVIVDPKEVDAQLPRR